MCGRSSFLFVALGGLIVAGCAETGANDGKTSQAVLKLAVTTSTRDSGLMEELLPVFEKEAGVRVDMVAVGTGAALRLGEAGDVDVVIAHARAAEDAFMKAGYGERREDLMYNVFVILGPKRDPANIGGLKPVAAMSQIARARAKFVSRGDDSGTHKRELALWKLSDRSFFDWDDYAETGQGMGPTLRIADEMEAYVLCDRGTYLNFRQNIALVPLVDSGEELANPYGVLVVNSNRHDAVDGEMANAFADFLIAQATQERIRDFRVAGEVAFYPAHLD